MEAREWRPVAEAGAARIAYGLVAHLSDYRITGIAPRGDGQNEYLWVRPSSTSRAAPILALGLTGAIWIDHPDREPERVAVNVGNEGVEAWAPYATGDRDVECVVQTVLEALGHRCTTCG